MVNESELMEQIINMYRELSQEDLLIEINRILGTDYVIDDIDWSN